MVKKMALWAGCAGGLFTFSAVRVSCWPLFVLAGIVSVWLLSVGLED